MALQFASLGSGSKGNGTVVRDGTTTVLIDCGFTLSEVHRRLERLGLSVADLDAVLVTHEHGDHVSGVARLARQAKIPVFASYGTFLSSKLDQVPRAEPLNAGDEMVIGGMSITAVPVPHDAREPVQYTFNQNGTRLGVLTDLGSITPHVLRHFEGCQGLLLECNHDEQMLAQGPYHAALKRRVASDYGHLNNRQSLEFLLQSDQTVLQELVIGHISEQNNSLAHAQAALAPFTQQYRGAIRYACQQDGFDWIEVV